MEILELASLAIKKVDSFAYFGSNEEMFITWGFSGILQTRDSNALERCNFQVISDDLIGRFPDDFEVTSYRHFLVGWVDQLTCRVFKNADDLDYKYFDDNVTDAFKAVVEWQRRLENYPIADEMLLSEMEYEELVDYLVSTFSLDDNQLGMALIMVHDEFNISRVEDLRVDHYIALQGAFSDVKENV